MTVLTTPWTAKVGLRNAVFLGCTNLGGSVNFKMSFWLHRFYQKTNEIVLRIAALASKKRSNQGTLLY